MLYIIHRINKIKELKEIPSEYGVEIDVRGYGNKLFLSHDPLNNTVKYDELEDYLRNFNHAFVVFNMKEAGYEKRVIDLAKKYKIKNYFLLDVEFPYLYQATRKDGIRKIAVRYSESEPIENVLVQIKNRKTLLDWVWIDTNTKLPLDRNVVSKLKPFSACLVCPERWGRPEKIKPYAKKIIDLDFKLDAIMTTLNYVKTWEKYL